MDSKRKIINLDFLTRLYKSVADIMSKTFIYFFILILFSTSFFGQNQLFKQTQTEHNLQKPVIVQLFNQGEKFRGQITEFVSEGLSYQIHADALEQFYFKAPQTLNLQLPEPLHVSLDLYQAEVFSHDFKLTTSEGKVYDFIDQPLFYRGIIKNDKNSIASVTVTKDEILIMYSDRNGNNRIQKTENNIYLAFKDEDIKNKPEFICGTTEVDGFEEKYIESPDDNLRYTTQECASVYVVCDYKSYLDHNSDLRETYLWVAKLWNEVITIYENEQIPVRVSSMYVYTVSDPFANLFSLYDILPAFENLYGSTTNGRFKHLLSTRNDLDDNAIGLASVGDHIICSPTETVATSFTLNTTFIQPFPIYSRSVFLLTHEMGHNLGSRHTHWCGWNGGPIDNCATQEGNNGLCPSCCSPGPEPPFNGGTIMSYCFGYPGVNFSLGFGSQPGNKIRNRYNWGKNKCNLGTCLTEGMRCVNAMDLPCGSSIQGTNNNAGWDNAPLCGPLISGPGMWFKFTGDGQNTIISTCSAYSYNTTINVYEGSCSSLVCVAGNDDYCNQGSQIAFTTSNGVIYYVLVQGSGIGDFTITRTCSTGPNVNDLYSNATILDCGQTLNGNTYWASTDYDVPTCNSIISAPGVWYKFTGNGQNTVISTCPQSNTFFARLLIYKLDNNNLVCVTNNDGYCFPGSQVSFGTLNGTEYYMLVHGFNNEKGEFDIARTCIDQPPGDLCSTALTLSCDATLIGNTFNASFDLESIQCSFDLPNITPGIWYTFIGDGQNTTISTCNQYSFDTRITAFKGQCSDLSCIGQSDDFCGWGSKISIPTISGEIYYILVDGIWEQGSFSISRTCSPPIIGDICSTAVFLACADTLAGSTLLAANDADIQFCGFNSSPGVWFKTIGSGEISKISICTQYDFNPQIQVYSGTCNDLVCVGYNYDFCDEGSQISFETEIDSNYFILVSGENEQGTFEIGHVCTSPIPGDECDSALILQCETTLTGNTSLASFDYLNPECSFTYNNSNGIWFKFSGNNKINELSVIGYSGFNSQITIYSGSCSGMDCVISENNFYSNNSFVSFYTDSLTEYFVLVHGYYSQGTFSISRSCKISSDICISAIEIDCGVTITGSTLNSTPDDNLPICGGIIVQSPCVWYKMTGNGQINEILTCSQYDFDTKITVYKNQDTYIDCDGPFVCVASNDNFCGLGSKVSFSTIYGVNYFIVVHGANGTTGNFEITRNCIIAPGDDCNNAIDLPVDVSIQGSTVGALWDFESPDCGEFLSEPGIWYSFYGNNLNNIISTCTEASFDTKIHIYKGSCNNLICVTSNDNFCDYKSKVFFHAESGEQYFVLVSGVSYWPQNGQGTFTITRECFTPAVNDFCENATVISCGQSISGNLLNGGVDLNNINCGNLNEVGLWYKIIGDGNNTFLNFSPFTIYKVFKRSCSQLICSGSLVGSFSTEIDTVYYVFVYIDPAFQGIQDNFTISRTCSSQIINDLCINATGLPCGVEVGGTTIGAANDEEVFSIWTPICPKSVSPGVWYQFIGNGQNMDIVTCADDNFFTEIKVFQNECGALVCVGDEVNYWYCGTGSRIIINTLADKKYFVLVSSYNSNNGDFTIKRNCIQPDAGDKCENAIYISCGQTLTGTTAAKPHDNPEIIDCVSGEYGYRQKGMWYKFIGNGQVAHISTCSNTSVHTNLHLYKYDCENLICVDNSSNCYSASFGADLNFLTVDNQQYFIFVEKDPYGDSGQFSLSLNCTMPEEGTSCSSALPLECGQIVTNSFADSWYTDSDILPFCGYNVSSRIWWYKFTGDGQNTIISTCSNQNIFDNTAISVYTGSCDSLICIASNNDFCGLHSTVSFQTIDDADYFIIVYSGDEEEFGLFTLSRSCTNDNCDLAIDLPCDVEISGSTINTLPSEGLSFCGTSVTSSGVWYKFTGNGQNTIINTCSFYNFDTKIHVYVGSCNNMTCLVQNDNFCNFGSQVSFPTVSGTQYYVFVYGNFDQHGNFRIKRTCNSDPLYCQSSGISSQFQWISEFGIGTFSNQSGNSSYTYFGNDTIKLSRGGNVEVSIAPDFTNSQIIGYYKIWIDFNKDGDFEDINEMVLNVMGDSIITYDIFIPQNVATGFTRMRISYDLLEDPQPCDIFYYGEVEDYLIDIRCNLVTSTIDNGTGSLRYVANCVDDGEIVLFSPELDNQIIQITNGPINVAGNWKWKSNPQISIIINAENVEKAIFIPLNRSLDIENLKIFGGTDYEGSVIENNGTLNICNSELISTNFGNSSSLFNSGLLNIVGNCKIK